MRSDSRIAVDDTGIYLIARDSDDRDIKFPLIFYTFNNATGTDAGFVGVTENQRPRYILTTSPGTQPIPSKETEREREDIVYIITNL